MGHVRRGTHHARNRYGIRNSRRPRAIGGTLADRPLRVALTGGIATGKSHSLRRFAELGAHVVDADVLAREVVEAGTAGHAAVVARFGRRVLDDRGGIDRAALASVVFSDATARHDLEAIVHPAVYAAIQTWFAGIRGGVAIADIPLLYETRREHDFDVVVVVACQPEEQLRRLMSRNHLSVEEARQRIAAQLPIDEKRRRADHVIDTSGPVEDTDRQIDELWKTLTTRR